MRGQQRRKAPGNYSVLRVTGLGRWRVILNVRPDKAGDGASGTVWGSVRTKGIGGVGLMQTKRKMRRRAEYRLGVAVLALIAAAAAPAQAQPGGGLVEFDIPAKALAGALKDYGVATDQQVIYPADLVRGKQAPAITGAVESGEALHRLLKDTGLGYERTGAQVIVIRPTLQKAMFVQEPERGDRVQEVETTERGAEREGREAPRPRDEVIVTGTNIRGNAPESSPFQIFDRTDILDSGLTTTEQFIRMLPQNVGSGSTEFTPLGLPTDTNSTQNNTYGSGANLRGLGSRGTLVLLNGNRLAPTSSIGDFIDLSLIPVSALKRIEVLTDGASSIYGGDAVAGVINFILRDDFAGAETSLRYGTVTQGDLDEFRLSQALGTTWRSGNILATYEYFNRDRLRLSDRPDIELFPPRTDSITLPDRSTYHLLPSQERHSAVVSARQELASVLAVEATALYSNRASDATSFGQNGTLNSLESTTESVTVAFAVDYDISDAWGASLNSSYSMIDNWALSEELQRADSNPLTARETVTESKLWSIDARINGELFSLPGGAVKVAFGGHHRQEKFENEIVDLRKTAVGERNVQALYGEFVLPIVGEGNARTGLNRLLLNLSGRVDRYSDFGTSFSPKVGVMWEPVEALRLRGSYGTSFAPPALGRAFELNRSGVAIPYTTILAAVGATVPDPSLAGVDLLQLSGTVPNLSAETSRTYTAGFDGKIASGRHTVTANGTYYNIRFEDRLGATPTPLGVSSVLATVLAWNDPSAFPEGSVVFFPSPEERAQILDSLHSPANAFLGASLDNIGVVDAVRMIRNLAITETDGIDLRIQYQFDAGTGIVTAGLNINHVFNFTDQASETTPVVSGLNTLYKPVDLNLRGRVGYSGGGFSGNLFVNHVAAYRTDDTPSALPIDAWTTIDVNVSYRFENARAWLNGVALSVAANNLFDTPPPSAPGNGSFLISSYDPANASPLGRFVAVELRKSF